MSKRYRVTLHSGYVEYREVDVEVEADSEEGARVKAREVLRNADELDWQKVDGERTSLSVGAAELIDREGKDHGP
jgi:hypothetical protein